MLSKPGAIVAALAEKTELFNFSTVQHEISRALRSAKDDPEDAVTAACSLIELSMSIDLGPIESAAPAQQRYRWSYARGSRFHSGSLLAERISPKKSRPTCARYSAV